MESIHEEGGTGLRSKDTVFTLPGKTGGHVDTAAREVRCQREHRFSSHYFLLHMGKNDVYLREQAI